MNATQLLAHFDRLAEAPNAVPRLRRFILDLAVRGKLVERDARDEPAAELLTRIKEEKDRLACEGFGKREKSLADVDFEEIPFSIPNSWSWARLQDITSYIQRGKSPNYAASDGVPVVSQKCVQWRGLDLSAARLITKESLEKYEPVRFLQNEDILWNSTGTGTIGRVVRVISPPKNLVCDSHVTVVRCTLANSEYVRSWLASDHVYGSIEDRAAGATNQVELNSSMATRQVIPLPPLAEQHRIVAKVDELMALCDQLEAAQQVREHRRDRLATASLQRLNQPAADTTPDAQRDHVRFHLQHLPRITTRPEHIKAIRQTIRKLAIVGQITSQDTNDEPASALLTKNLHWRTSAIKRKQIRDPRKELLVIGEDDSPYLLPKQWSWARLGEVIYIQSGDGLTAANMKDGSIPVFGGNGVNGHHDAFNIDEPTLVIGRVGYYCGSIHITPERAWVTDNAFVTHFCPDLFSMRFLALLLATTNLKENEGATAQPVISGSKIYPLIVGIPPLAEQHRIVAKVDELVALCDQLEAQLATTQTDSHRLLGAVLDEALGIVRVPKDSEVDISPSSIVDLDPQIVKASRFMTTNPAMTVDQLLECIDDLGGSASPDRLLKQTGLGEDVEAFYDLLRAARDGGRVTAQLGVGEIVRKHSNAD